MDINKILTGKDSFSGKNALNFYINNSSEVIFTVDIDGKVKFVNEAFCMFIGYEKKDLFDKNISDFMDKENAEKLSLMRKSGEDESFKIEILFKAANNISKWLYLKIFPYKGVLVFIGRDISEGKNKREERNNQIRNIEEEKVRSMEILDNIGDGVMSV